MKTWFLYGKGLSIVFVAFLFSCTPLENSNGVAAVYPTSDTLPANLLRMYIQFTEPMKTVGNLQKIKLTSSEGHEVKGAIFMNVHELWDEKQTQLTLIFDPGRVKTGLQAYEQLGWALRTGQTYELIVEGLENIYHQEVRRFSKKFFVTEADLEPPNIDLWQMSLPKSDSKDPLRLHFNEMVDQMSIRHRLVVIDGKGLLLPGTYSFDNNELEWSFSPSELWDKGFYTILVNSRLADPSGNNLNGLFDHPVGSLKYNKEGELLRLDFEVDE